MMRWVLVVKIRWDASAIVAASSPVQEKYPDYPYCLVMEGGVEDLVESMSKSGSTPMPENQIRDIPGFN
eukprot:1160741-Pelagomonas_calceolata.AAC.11